MANDCLISKLRKQVQNEYMQTYDTVFLDLTSLAEGYTQGNVSLCIEVADNATTNTVISSSIPFHLGSSSGTEMTKDVLLPGQKRTWVFLPIDIGSVAVGKFLKIEGIYNIARIGMYTTGNRGGLAFVRVGLHPNSYNGMSSLLNYSHLIGICTNLSDYKHTDAADYAIVDSCFKGIEYLSVVSYDTRGEQFIDITNVISQSLKVLVCSAVLSNFTPKISIAQLAETSIVALSGTGRLSGNIKDFPISLKFISNGTYFNTNGIEGSIEEYVEAMRNKGKTSGFLIMDSNITTNCAITYNGQLLSGQVENLPKVNISSFDMLCLTWDASNIGFTSTLPQEATNYRTDITLYNYDSNVYI